MSGLEVRYKGRPVYLEKHGLRTLKNLPFHKQQQLWNLLETVEDFVDAKIDYANSHRANLEWANSDILDNCRDRLVLQLVELLR